MAAEDSTHPGEGAAADEPRTVEKLVDDDTGRWQITTEASIYVLDLDQRTMLRVPGAGAGVHRHPDGEPVRVTTLASDHKPVFLLQLLHCHVGESMYLLTEPWADGSVMVRGSTVVREIRSLPAADSTPRAAL